MSGSRHTCVTVEEDIPLSTTPGSGHNGHSVQSARRGAAAAPASCCGDHHHRKLAMSSIVCGCTCIGIVALINSVKAEEASDPEIAAKFSQRAKKFGIISILTWILCLLSLPMLLALGSYLITLKD